MNVRVVIEDEDRPIVATTYVYVHPVGGIDSKQLLGSINDYLLRSLSELRRLRTVA